MLTENRFDTGELVINYSEGAPSGPPLVMLHGATLWWKELQILASHLEPSWHIYACDHRGHGKSGRAAAGQYRVIDYARDVVAFLTQHVRDSAVLLGFSLGGWVALQVAAQQPSHVRALILLDPPLELRELRLNQLPQFGWFSWVYETITSSPSLTEVIAKCKTFNPALDDAGAAEMAEMLYSLDPQGLAMLLGDSISTGFDWTNVYHKISCPTLLLWGEQIGILDPSVVRPEDVAFLHTHVAQAESIQIKGAGHPVHWQKTDEVIGHITAFVSSINSL